MSGLASVPSISASVNDRRGTAAAPDYDLAQHRQYIDSIWAWVDAVRAAAAASDEDLAYHHQTEAACPSPTQNQTRRTSPNIASLSASVGSRRAAAMVESDEEDLAYHRMEAALSSSTPNQTRRTPLNRPPPSNFGKIFIRSFTTFSGIIVTASPFVYRFAYHDPSLQQDPFLMILLASFGLMVMAAGFALTSDDCLYR